MRWSWVEIMRFVLANLFVIFFLPIVVGFILIVGYYYYYTPRPRAMGRKNIIKGLAKKAASLVPYHIITLFD